MNLPSGDLVEINHNFRWHLAVFVSGENYGQWIRVDRLKVNSSIIWIRRSRIYTLDKLDQSWWGMTKFTAIANEHQGVRKLYNIPDNTLQLEVKRLRFGLWYWNISMWTKAESLKYSNPHWEVGSLTTRL